MSQKISNLFLTRGAPGTHDTKMLFQCIKNLKAKKFKYINIPKFDKSIDDRVQKRQWLKVKKKPNIVIFEGWCVGATAQKNKDLNYPINKLEKQKDSKKVWRQKVNLNLKKDYKSLIHGYEAKIFVYSTSD